jgi:hypothetical protein
MAVPVVLTATEQIPVVLEQVALAILVEAEAEAVLLLPVPLAKPVLALPGSALGVQEEMDKPLPV